MSDESQALLIAEQIKHSNSLLKAEVAALRAELDHLRAFDDHRLEALEGLVNDHELRIRSATDGVTQFKMWSGVANGGAGVLSLAALLKSFLIP